MLIIALAQIQMGFNVSALPVSIGGIVEDFNTSPSSVSTALVVYSLAVAGFVILGAKLGKLIGSRLAFQIGVIFHGAGDGGDGASAPATTMMIQMQAIAGLAAAILVPSLVVLIANHYKGAQQSQSLGLLGAAQAIAGVLAFLVIGVLGTLLSWRYGFALIVFIAVLVFLLSFKLKPVERIAEIKIDWVGALLAALAIILISIGFQQPQSLGHTAGFSRCAGQCTGDVASLHHDRHRDCPGSGILCLVKKACGEEKDAAAGFGSARLTTGTGRDLLPLYYRCTRPGGQLPDPAVYPDCPGL